MDTAGLKKFAQLARGSLIEQIGSKLEFVLKPESSARREYPTTVNQLEKAMAVQGKASLIDQVAYTWFNRFCALRFMDTNGYNRVGVVSPTEGQVQPEILAEAKSGVIDDSQINQKTAHQIRGLLSGSISSPDAQGEAYRLLIVGSCNSLYKTMPFLFERIQDFTELLMPDDLLSENSVLTKMRGVMTTDACQDVEIIGWLYQFYISEKKDEVFAGLKKNQKITAENIPAATQLFTPHWIVRYLVENSLGRLWLLNRPNSSLAEQMDYYIAPEEPETDFLKITKPEEIRICDPAAGSGHMLTYAFDLLYAIYEEEGYDATEIPALILAHNLTGIEIDERAGSLASFALAMKAAEKLGRRRFLRLEVKPDICVLQDVSFDPSELQDIEAMVGRSLFTADLRATLTQFEQAKNFGSLIIPKLKDPHECLRVVEAQDLGGDMFRARLRERLLNVLQMSEALSSKYHVVVANPPYLGGKGMNGSLGDYAKKEYPDSKSDLFAMFMDRTLALAVKRGMMAMINMQSWMFLSSYEKLRGKLLSNATLLSMAHLGERGFDTIGGAVVSTTAFVFAKERHKDLKGEYVRLIDGRNEAKKSNQFKDAIENPSCGWFYRASANDFEKIPGSPIAYWLSEKVKTAFVNGKQLSEIAKPVVGLQTGENAQFVREWFEVNNSYFEPNSSHTEKSRDKKWFPYNKGGDFRKWYGNQENIVNWENDGFEIKNFTDEKGKLRSRPQNTHLFFRQSISWSKISSGAPAFRFFPEGFIFDVAGTSIFTDEVDLSFGLMGFCNSKTVLKILTAVSPTLNFEVGHIASLPILDWSSKASTLSERAVNLSKSDWDAYETSWDFTTLPLLSSDYRASNIADTYAKLRAFWQSITDEMQRLEEENNKIFINAYGLQEELTPEVPIKEITLTCNPHYRYGGNMTDEELEDRLLSDTMAEFLSYAVGCMFGRYSLDKPGLLLANQGERLEDYLTHVPTPTFEPDEDNVIPIIDFEGDWFQDDISERFKQFLRITFGDEHYSENLAFIENALGKSIQKYFIKDFYTDHIKRYKKRPIYWQISSPKGTFNALVYMHRYRSDTISVVLNDYLREFRTKLEARRDSSEQISISISASQKEKTQALKMIDQLNKAINEVVEFERDILYPLAGQNITIDLDDGVKNNYPLFGTALKKIPGLS